MTRSQREFFQRARARAQAVRGNLAAWLRRMFLRDRAPQPSPTNAAPPPAPAEPVAIVQVPVSVDHAELRRLERARRRFDKFVTPKGEMPERKRAQTQEVKPQRKVRIEEVVDPSIKDDVDDAEMRIADTHHEDRDGANVLFKEAEMYGEFNFRDTILQQLDRYFFYLRRMKKGAPDVYEFYRQVGATVLPYLATGVAHRPVKGETIRAKDPPPPLAPWFNATRPSFGCYAYGADPESEKIESLPKDAKGYVSWIPKFMYFEKFSKPPPELQHVSGGDVYVMTVWWDRPAEKNCTNGSPQQIGFHISRDGQKVTALRMISTERVPVRPKKKRAGGNGHYAFAIPQRAWRLPHDYTLWARQHGFKDTEHFLTDMFLHTLNLHERGNLAAMVRVAASKDDMTAAFTVNVHRTAYFFQDRDIELDENGTRKRIFHQVRPHVRADGTAVKTHFRGTRDFTWAGYAIRISVPGRDHIDINRFDVGAEDEYWVPRNELKKSIFLPELGKRMRNWMLTGFGPRKRDWVHH